MVDGEVTAVIVFVINAWTRIVLMEYDEEVLTKEHITVIGGNVEKDVF